VDQFESLFGLNRIGILVHHADVSLQVVCGLYHLAVVFLHLLMSGCVGHLHGGHTHLLKIHIPAYTSQC